MTSAPKRPCRHPGCSALVERGEGTYCAAHRRTSPATVSRQLSDRHRGSAASRGYDADWQRYRFGFLAQWPLCMGVLIPDMTLWSLALAAEFHAIREAQRETGRVASYGPEALAWLLDNPIYRLELWDLTRPAVVVDHIVPHKGDYELMWSPANHQPVTKRAHDRKTATESKQPKFNTEAAEIAE